MDRLDAQLLGVDRRQLAFDIGLCVTTASVFAAIARDGRAISVTILAVLAVMFAARARTVRRRGSLLVENGRVYFETSETRMELTVRRARVSTWGSRAALELECGTFGEALFIVEERDEAHAFAQHAGLAAPYTFRSRGRLGRFTLVAAVATLACTSWWNAWLPSITLTAVFATLAAYAVSFALGKTVEMGDDGIALTWMGTRRFVPLSTVRSFRRVREGGVGAVLEITRSGGEPLRIVVGKYPLLTGALENDAAEEVRTVEACLRELLAHREIAPEVLRAFEASSSSDLVTLRALAARVSSFRDAPLTPEELLQVAACTGTTLMLRAQAAIVVRATSGDATPLARIASTTAHPALRIAMSATATDDELVEALATLEREAR